jgi:hypothetical protein
MEASVTMAVVHLQRGLVRALCAFAVAGPALAADEKLTSASAINDAAADAFWWGDFDALQRMHTEYLKPDQFDADGRSKLASFQDGLGRVFDGTKGMPDAYFLEVEALTLSWAQRHPQSSLAHAMHAKALMTHAWSYRGTGYANTVPPQAWADFNAYVDRAAKYLAAHAAVVLTTSTGYKTSVDVGRAAGWGQDRLWAITRAGLDKHPDDETLYRSMLSSLLPKWGGNPQALDRFVREAVERTRARRGQEMYARLYSVAASEQFSHQLFSESGAQWTTMKQGFEDLLTRYPTASNVNRYAYFACMAQDKPTALDLLARIGAKPEIDRWGSNGGRTYETCKRWASQQ